MSNQSQGAVLAGQPVAVTAGSGITIDPNTGVISVNASTITGVMKLNNGSAYNAYQWPNSPGTNGQFLQTNGAGLVDWADVQGFAVVSVQSGAPSPADIGELWFDCDTGTLNVYQNCVGTPSPNWFNVAQPGFPVLPANTSSDVAWTGSGTQASPYQMTVTTTGSGSAVQILNTVTINGLSPFQYVPIVDLNAVANGGRFSFTNNYADSSGQLIFNTVFTDLPPSGSGIIYNAAIKVGYGSVYIDAQVTVVAALVVTGGSIAGPLYVGQQLTYTPGVPSGGSTPYGSPTIKWFANGNLIGGATAPTFTLTGAQLNAQITASTTYTDASAQTATGTSAAVGPVLANPGTLTITSPGSISPSTNVSVGTTLNYTAGTFTGGIPTVTPSWVWQRAGTNITGTANATSYITVPADSGQAITVRYQVQDSATPTPVTQFASTTAVTPTSPFPGGVWAPTPAGAMNNNNPGTSSGLWNGANGATITATGCAEVSTDGTNYFPSLTVSIGQTLYQRWKQTALCGLNDTGQTIQGSVTDGTYTNSYSLQINRVPSAPPSYTAATGAPGAVVDSNSQTISGMNSTTYITYDASSTGDATTYFAIINGGSPQAIPAAPSTSLTIQSGDILVLRQTASSTPATARNLVVNIGDADGNPRQQATYTVTSVSTPFPSTTFTPTNPNAAPVAIVPFLDPVLGVNLNPVASVSSGGNTWTAGGTTLTGSNIQVSIAGAAYAGSGAIANGQSLAVAWDVNYLNTLAHDANASGTISGTISGTTYSNSFGFQVKKSPNFAVPTGVINVPLGSTVNTGTMTVDGYNCPVTVSISAPTTASTATMTAVTYTVAGVGPTTLTVPGTFTIYPSQTLLISGTVNSTAGDFNGLTITIGSATPQEWRVRNATATPAITTPSITSPSGSPPTLLNPALNSPAGITLQGSQYTPTGGASATQTSSSWEVYKDGPAGTFQSTATISAVAPATLTVGTPTGGGYFAGQIRVPGGTGTIYNLIVAPVRGNNTGPNPSGTLLGQYSTDGGATPATIQWKTSASAETGGNIAQAQDEAYGGTWTATAGGTTTSGLGGLYPLFGWCKNSSTGPNGGGGIGGFTDWYIPAKNELEVLYYYFKPNSTVTQANNTTSGSNPNAVAPEPVSTNYTTTDPAQTTAVPFQGTNAQAFSTANNYWSSSEVSGNTSAAWRQIFTIGVQNILGNKNVFHYARAVRRVATTGSGSIQTLSITGADTDGFTVGMAIKGSSSGATGIITAINGTSVTITQTSSTAFNNTDKIEGNGTIVSGSPFSGTVQAGLTDPSVLVPQSALTTSSTYYARVQYATTNSQAATSSFSNWSSFATAAAFTPAPGTQMGGGYYAGQIVGAGGTSGAGGLDNLGTIYNLIVAPVGPVTQGANTLYGQNGGSTPTGIQYKTSATANGNANAQNRNFGALCTDELKSDPLYPVFNTFINGATGPNAGAFNLTTGGSSSGTGIGGYNNWYLPAGNELAVLYFFLKPDGTTNSTVSGGNPQSVAPYTPNTNYGPGFPNVTTADGTGGTGNFLAGNTQAFSTTTVYLSSTEASASAPWRQNFSSGSQTIGFKTDSLYARAVRRVAA